MAKIIVQFELDSSNLEQWDDRYLAQFWQIAQANPVHFGDAEACAFAESVGREIIRRFVRGIQPELWHCKAAQSAQAQREAQAGGTQA